MPLEAFDSSLYTREPSAAARLRKAKAFWNHRHRWFSLCNKNRQEQMASSLDGLLVIYLGFKSAQAFGGGIGIVVVGIDWNGCRKCITI